VYIDEDEDEEDKKEESKSRSSQRNTELWPSPEEMLVVEESKQVVS